MTTNQPTPVILSDADLVEIEQLARVESWRLFARIPALCQTVRALRVQVAQAEQAFELESAVRLPEVGNLNVLQVVRKMAELHETNTTLREQLAENARRHFDDARSLERQRNEALDQCTELHRRLAQVEKERDELRNALLPFALLDIRHLQDRPDTEPIWAINKSQITNGHIRNAARLLQAAVVREKQP